MDRMKKLLMMDSRTFNRLTSSKDKVLTSIEGEMSSILKDESIPEDVRTKFHSSAQSRYLKKIEHPQWGESDVKNLANPAAPVNIDAQNYSWRSRPLSRKLKKSTRVSTKDKHELPVDREDIIDPDETVLYDTLITPKDFEKATLMTPNIIEKSWLMTPNDIENPRELSAVSRAPSVYVTPGRPNTRRRRKIKNYETLY